MGKPEVNEPCTGIAAVWCPIHGTCQCLPPCPMCSTRDRVSRVGPDTFRCAECDTDFDEGEPGMWKDDPSCPLHSDASTHAVAAPAPPVRLVARPATALPSPSALVRELQRQAVIDRLDYARCVRDVVEERDHYREQFRRAMELLQQMRREVGHLARKE